MESIDDRKITVSEETARLIREKLDSGSFDSAADVVGAAMEALGREEESQAAGLAEIRARIKASVDDPRPRVPMEAAFDRVLGRLKTKVDDR